MSEVEQGAASILVKLKNGDILIYHGTDLDVLGRIENAPPGSWQRIWDLFTEMGMDRGDQQ